MRFKRVFDASVPNSGVKEIQEYYLYSVLSGVGKIPELGKILIPSPSRVYQKSGLKTATNGDNKILPSLGY